MPARPAAPGRAEVVAILAAFGDRLPEEVPEDVDSMELAWLVHRLEQTYGGTVPESALVRMTTVSAVLDEVTALVTTGTFAAGPAGGTPGTAAAGPLGAGTEAPAAVGEFTPGDRPAESAPDEPADPDTEHPTGAGEFTPTDRTATDSRDRAASSRTGGAGARG